ncbi:hypothetical protein ACFUYE_05255 [Micromonospora humida]|uniref:hypothetical protein n=1 Tax=Micromonospora humida TaxID=2809018 RepID=UPI0036723553
MTARQLDLFAADDSPVAAPAALTVADLDEWIAVTRNVAHPHVSGHYPNEWARTALGELLGEEIPHRRWSTRDLVATLTRARRIAADRSIQAADAPTDVDVIR